MVNGGVYIKLSNLSEIARNAYTNANLAAGSIKTWKDENGQATIGPAISRKIAGFSISVNGANIDRLGHLHWLSRILQKQTRT